MKHDITLLNMTQALWVSNLQNKIVHINERFAHTVRIIDNLGVVHRRQRGPTTPHPPHCLPRPFSNFVQPSILANGWSHHIWCAISLNDIMDLHM